MKWTLRCSRTVDTFLCLVCEVALSYGSLKTVESFKIVRRIENSSNELMNSLMDLSIRLQISELHTPNFSKLDSNSNSFENVEEV